MKKTVKTEILVMAAAVLAQVKIDKMQDKEKFALIRATRPVKKVAEEYQELRKDALERLKPDDYDALLAKEQAEQEFTPDEADRVRKYNADVEECVNAALAKEVELEFDPLTEDGVLNLSASNPEMPLGTVMELMTLFCDSDKSDESDGADMPE